MIFRVIILLLWVKCSDAWVYSSDMDLNLLNMYQAHCYIWLYKFQSMNLFTKKGLSTNVLYQPSFLFVLYNTEPESILHFSSLSHFFPSLGKKFLMAKIHIPWQCIWVSLLLKWWRLQTAGAFVLCYSSFYFAGWKKKLLSKNTSFYNLFPWDLMEV